MNIQINIDGSITFPDEVKQLLEDELQRLKMIVWESFNALIEENRQSKED